MLSELVTDLLSTGLSEAEIGLQIGLAQSSVNRIKLGKQKNTGFASVDKLRKLHQERCPHKYIEERVA